MSPTRSHQHHYALSFRPRSVFPSTSAKASKMSPGKPPLLRQELPSASAPPDSDILFPSFMPDNGAEPTYQHLSSADKDVGMDGDNSGVSTPIPSTVISGFSSDDEDWFQGSSQNDCVGKTETEYATEELPSLGITQAADARLSSPSKSPGSTGILDQITFIQSQLHSLTISLSETAPETIRNTSSSDATAKELTFYKSDNARLKSTNINLRRLIRMQNEQIEELKREKAQSFERSNNEDSRMNIGVDPAAVIEIAFDLASGARKKNAVADALFALCDTASPYPAGPEEVERERLEPRERLRNLEGVMDVTLGRLETVEANYAEMKGWDQGRAGRASGGGGLTRDGAKDASVVSQNSEDVRMEGLGDQRKSRDCGPPLVKHAQHRDGPAPAKMPQKVIGGFGAKDSDFEQKVVQEV